MRELKHTPGPWKHIENSNWIGVGNNCIATTNRQNFNLKSDGRYEECEEVTANAKLIAAAPELLEALSVMTSLCRLKYGNLDKDVYDEILKAESVIKKATV